MKKVLLLLTLCTPLHSMQNKKRLTYHFREAIRNHNYRKVTHCLQKGVQVNTPLDPLLQAVAVEDEKICALLLAQGANPDGWMKSGNPLFLAATHENLRLCSLLLESGADPNCEKNKGLPALHIAYMQNNHELYQLLSDAGAEIFDPELALIRPLLLNQTEMIQTIITQSNINKAIKPHTLKKFFDARKRIATSLVGFARCCPKMPKEIKKHILEIDPELHEDYRASRMFGKLQNIKLCDWRTYPLQLLRYMIQTGYFTLQEVIEQLKKDTLAYFQDLAMIPSFLSTSSNQEKFELLNEDRFEQNYGADIEKTIKRRLGASGLIA